VEERTTGFMLSNICTNVLMGTVLLAGIKAL
jgi:hypothetical protein